MELLHSKAAQNIYPNALPGAAIRSSAGESRATRWVVGCALIAFFVKIAIALNTFGTNDVASFYLYARSLHDHGLEWTYRNGVPWGSNLAVFNHPPLTAWYLELIGSLSANETLRAVGLAFPFWLRLPGIIADLVTVLLLLRISKLNRQLHLPVWALCLFALSPVSLMVAGFHGNTDSVMVMFLVAASYLCLCDRAALCGILLAMSCQIKIVPLLFFPILFFFWLHRKTALRFTVSFSLLMLAIWSYPLASFPKLFLGNVVAYGSYWGAWGITYWLKLTRFSQFDFTGFANLPLAAAIVASVLKLVIIAASLLIGWRRRALDSRSVILSVAYLWIIFFVFTPGFCSYYLVWLAPFVVVLSPQFYAWLTATSAIFLFVFYNTLAHGLPWYIAVSKFSDPIRFNVLAPWGLWPWATVVVGLVIYWKRAVVGDPVSALAAIQLSPNSNAVVGSAISQQPRAVADRADCLFAHTTQIDPSPQKGDNC